MWVGVIVTTGEDWKGSALSPAVLTTDAKDDQHDAMAAAQKKAAMLLRMSALVSTGNNTEALMRAASDVEAWGVASWVFDDTPREIVVKVSELSDEVRTR